MCGNFTNELRWRDEHEQVALGEIVEFTRVAEFLRQRNTGQINHVLPFLRNRRDLPRIMSPKRDWEFVFVQQQRERSAPAARADDAEVGEAHTKQSEHPTSNTQHPTSNGPGRECCPIGCWMLGVGCWVFIPFIPF